ncbi:hypothetical protein Ahy_A01g004466 [Arachis hypogaea]|uniref:Protein kinase domain-containing protein n=1 Tax=Arachis hypogaea TaxID=3818 RepID=A0A445EW70_ARAHY|nr:hypothetical protein Ahy_A01g004466 [Arachis hypogaea]
MLGTRETPLNCTILVGFIEILRKVILIQRVWYQEKQKIILVDIVLFAIIAHGIVLIGQGRYDVVCKASLNDGRQVTVKVVKETKGSVKEFVNKVVIMNKTSHVNIIVSLLGFCYKMNKQTLIYEFMSNGSLNKFTYKQGYSHLISNLD